MPLKINVKINAVTNLSDARYAAGMGVNLVGFCLDTLQLKYIEPLKIAAIAQWISGVQVVFEFNEFDAEQYELAVQQTVPQYIQVNNTEHWDLLEKTALPIIHRIQVADDLDIAQLLLDSPAYYLFVDGITQAFIVQHAALLADLASHKKLILGGDFNTANLSEWIKYANPWAIAIEGGEEIKPGLKTFDEMADLLELLEEE